jgi:hypothetical protein
MKFFRRTAGCTLFDHDRDGEVLEELKAEPVGKKLRRYKSNSLRHVTRTNSNRMTKIKLKYRSKWKKTTWKTFGRLLGDLETGLSRPNS